VKTKGPHSRCSVFCANSQGTQQQQQQQQHQQQRQQQQQQQHQQQRHDHPVRNATTEVATVQVRDK